MNDNEGKALYKSKRFWFTVASALFSSALPFFPVVQAFVSNNPAVVGWVFTTISAYVGVKTTEPLKIPFVAKK